MATRQGALTARVASQSRKVSADSPTFAARALAWLDRAMLGGATPRGYRPEGYSDLEMHQIVSGHKDRFDVR
jgi:hypothetical protein